MTKKVWMVIDRSQHQEDVFDGNLTIEEVKDKMVKIHNMDRTELNFLIGNGDIVIIRRQLHK